jgi:hypothetical protein
MLTCSDQCPYRPSQATVPVQLPGFPFKHSRVLHLDKILQLGQLPRLLAVVGAGDVSSKYTYTLSLTLASGSVSMQFW